MGILLGMLSMPIIFLALALIAALVVLVTIAVFRKLAAGRARRFGYPSTSAYLEAAPRSDAEKRDAVDLALKGLVCCIVGIVFPPLLLVGLVPLFYGGRKLAYSQLGLGLVDDGDQPQA